MGTKRDYYEILGVSRNASTDEIKKSYRKLVMQFHPDRVTEDKKKEAEEKFKEISEAYAVLSDSKKRQLYDQYGHAGIDSRFSTEDIFRSANFEDIFSGMSGFGSIFEDFFSDLGLPVEEIKNYTQSLEGFIVPIPEVLLILKTITLTERKGTTKGKKDLVDIFSLLKGERINWRKYKELIEKYNLKEKEKELKNLVSLQVAVPELNLLDHQISKLKKEILRNL